MIGESRAELAATKTSNVMFIDGPTCQLTQYFPSIWMA